MQETKVKIWDFSKSEFISDPTGYVKMQYVKTLNNALHIYPVIRPEVNAEMVYFSGYQDQHGIDIYGGDRLLFFDTKEHKPHMEILDQKPDLLIWVLGEFLFEDVYFLKIVGNKFNDSAGQNLSNFL